MSEEYVVIPKSEWVAILDAMRAKEGSSDAILAGELAEKIEAIEKGITPEGEIEITKNGTHDVTAYASAAVNIPIPNGYVYPSGNKPITSNGTEIDVKNYATVSVDVPVPSGYVYTSGTKLITANGTNIDVNSYKAVDVNVSVPSGNGGYAGVVDSNIRHDRDTITFSCDTNGLIGYVVLCNDMEPGSSDVAHIVCLAYTGNINETYNYYVVFQDGDGNIITGRMGSFEHSVNNGTITIELTASDIRFASGYTYYFMPFYSESSDEIILG